MTAISDAPHRRFSRSRREVLITFPASIAALAAGPAVALQEDAAVQHVETTIDAILELIVSSGTRAQNAARLREIIETYTAVEFVARFAAGRAWRDMSEAQQTAFVDAFTGYAANEYAGQFQRFEGSVDELRKFVRIRGVDDAGRKGLLVRTEVLPIDELPIAIDWLVSDRSGQIAVADLVVEGISLAITQREIIAGMLEARAGDMDAVIRDLIARS